MTQRSPTALILATSLVVLSANISTHAGDQLRRRGLIGVQLAPAPADPDAPGKPGKGVLVQGTLPDTPGQAAGLQGGDIIVKVNGADVNDQQGFFKIMRQYFGNDTVTFEIRRGKETLEKKLTLQPRPQETPEKYDIIYDHVDANGLKLRTYITKPKKDGKFPALIMLPSPQPQPQELAQPQFADHPLKKLLDHLTESGVVTMRVERPGVGDSEGDNPQAVSLQTDVQDYAAAAKKIREYKFVDPSNVYIFSMGMGSAVAPLAAAKTNVNGVILYASTIARPLPASLVEMMKRNWYLETKKTDEKDTRPAKLEKFLTLAVKPDAKPSKIIEDNPDLKDLIEPLQQGGGDDYIIGIYHQYFRDMANTDYADAWGKVNSDVLVLWGEADFQANRGDSEMIVESINKTHPGKAKLITLPGVDHIMSKAKDQEDSFLTAYQGAEYNPVVVEALLKWIGSRSATST